MVILKVRFPLVEEIRRGGFGVLVRLGFVWEVRLGLQPNIICL
jgi:hypothetical protein